MKIHLKDKPGDFFFFFSLSVKVQKQSAIKQQLFYKTPIQVELKSAGHFISAYQLKSLGASDM